MTIDTRRLDDARRVLRVLVAAFPTYPVNDDTTELYLAVIAEEMTDFATAMRVVTDWATGELLFPKPVELVERYHAEIGRAQRRATQAEIARQHEIPGMYACPHCEDAGVEWVKWVEQPGDRLVEGVLPCSRCRPDDREYQNDGHYAPQHRVHLCTHPRCETRAKRLSRHHR